MTTAPTDRQALLASLPLLGGLAPEQLGALARLARIERFRRGAVIFRKGDAGLGLMGVIGGAIQISVVGPDGREIVLNVIRPGEVFGEIALLDGQPRTADAIALEDCELLVLDRREFLPFLQRTPEACVKLLEIVSRRLRRTTLLAEEAMLMGLEERLARQLLRLAEEFGRPVDGGVRIDLRISQRQLGAFLGVSRESVNKQLAAWQGLRLVEVRRGQVTLLAPGRLRALANEEPA